VPGFNVKNHVIQYFKNGGTVSRTPIRITLHAANPLSLYVCREHRIEPVPPQPNGLMTYVDTAFEKQIFDIS